MGKPAQAHASLRGGPTPAHAPAGSPTRGGAPNRAARTNGSRFRGSRTTALHPGELGPRHGEGKQ
eukprot:2431443-Lingulodinium_polyedra.AAC.1